MDVNIDKDWLKALHEILVLIYEDTDDPVGNAIPLVQDYDESLISICVDRHNTKIFGKVFYPHTLQKAAVLMHSIISFHPFVDGNKRIGHAVMEIFLNLNGYDLVADIDDQEDFMLRLASGELALDELREWLVRHSYPITSR